MILVQGREHEWLFSSAEGQQQLAAGCASRRVVVVSLGRGHTFPPLPALQVPIRSPVSGMGACAGTHTRPQFSLHDMFRELKASA